MTRRCENNAAADSVSVVIQYLEQQKNLILDQITQCALNQSTASAYFPLFSFLFFFFFSFFFFFFSFFLLIILLLLIFLLLLLILIVLPIFSLCSSYVHPDFSLDFLPIFYPFFFLFSSLCSPSFLPSLLLIFLHVFLQFPSLFSFLWSPFPQYCSLYFLASVFLFSPTSRTKETRSAATKTSARLQQSIMWRQVKMNPDCLNTVVKETQ